MMKMNNSIKDAFDSIHAQESLKDKTKVYVKHTLHRRHKRRFQYVMTGALVLILCLVIGGYKAYYTPVAALSLDMDSSIELELNIFNRVINMKEYNRHDNKNDFYSIHHMNYIEAIQTILSYENISADDLELTVYCQSTGQSKTLQNDLTSQISILKNRIYHTANHDEIKTAHQLGVSFGKYRAYLSLLEVDPETTVEDIEDLSMSEIHDCLQEKSRQHHQNHHGYSHQ